MIIELMIQHYLTSPNIKNIIKLRKIAYLGAKFFLAPCFFMLVCAISWEQRKLGDMGETYTGLSGKTKEDFGHGNAKFVTYMNVFSNSIADLSMTESVEIDKKQNEVNYGDVFFTTSSETPDEVGMSSVWLENSDNTYLNSFCFGYRPSVKVNPYYMAYMLRSDNVRKNIVFLAQGISRYNISKNKMMEISVPLPNLEEQQKIGEYFRNLDTLITLHQREYFLFDFSGESAKTAQNTLSWEQRKLGDMGETYTGLSGKTKEDFGHGNAKFVTYMNVFSNSIADLSMTESVEIDKKQNEVNYGDVFFTTSSETPDEVGMSSVWLENSDNTYLNSFCFGYRPSVKVNPYYMAYMLRSDNVRKNIVFLAQGISRYNISKNKMMEISVPLPNLEEQQKIGEYFRNLDTLITLHQREPPKEDKILNDIKTDTLFHEYYCQWLVIYKEGSVRGVTMQKYHLTAEWVKKLIPDVKLCDFDRITYQQLINDYAETHERQTTMDFHHQLKGAILDAVDDGLIARDPTRKVIIKGKSPNDKKKKYLSRYELQKLLTNLDLNSGLNMDWLILLIAKTGMRFSEAIAVTPVDFDFTHQTLSVNKTWDYKGEGGFQPTKNKSSVRKIRLDWQTVGQFYAIVRELNDTAPIFVSKEKKIYNSTLNDVLERHCKAVGIPTISVHGLRHTHASLLLFDGVSIASVAQRLGHSSINTTQKTYLHIIRELENKDIDLIMKSISSLLD